jgi:hypothetical protein
MNKYYKSFYLVSNACSDIYPDNSLTNFKNKLPSPIEIDETVLEVPPKAYKTTTTSPSAGIVKFPKF